MSMKMAYGFLARQQHSGSKTMEVGGTSMQMAVTQRMIGKALTENGIILMHLAI